MNTMFIDIPIFKDVLRVRESLIMYGFWDQATVDRFVELFQQYIECLKYEYNPTKCTISLKIKKTSIRKIPKYCPKVHFYYNIIGNVMMVILKENKERVIKCLSNYLPCFPEFEGRSVYDVYFSMINDPSYLYNLANVQCIMDNFVQIIL